MEGSLSIKKVSKKKKGNFLKDLKRDYQLWIMVLPAILVIFVFNYIPMYGIQLAFKNFDFTKGLTGGDFVGLKYFKQFFQSDMFGALMINTFRISIASVIFGFIAPIVLALIINQIQFKNAKKVMETTVYLPHFISIVVMVGMLNVFFDPSSGVLTAFLKLFGINSNILGSTKTFVPLYVISDIWQHCGWNSIIYLAALSSVDTQLYEAARIDGASRWKLIRHVDIPAIMPTMVILLVLSMGGVLGAGFDKTFLMQNNLNLPVSEVISTYTYKIGILSNQFSYSTAIGLFNTIVNFVFLTVTNEISKKVSDTSIW